MIRFVKASVVTGALAALGLFAGVARAGYQDFFFSGQVAATAAPGTPTVFGNTAAVTTAATPSGSDTTTFTALNNGGGAVAAPTSIIFGNVTDLGLAGGQSANININYDFKITFTVDPSGSSNPPNHPASFTIDILGNLSGPISRNAQGIPSYGVQNSFSPTSYTVFVPGEATYVITPNAFVPPSTGPGSFSAFVTATPVPEPTTFALLGVGGLLLAAPYLRRKARNNTA